MCLILLGVFFDRRPLYSPDDCAKTGETPSAFWNSLKLRVAGGGPRGPCSRHAIEPLADSG
jgi:hypothetical protein